VGGPSVCIRVDTAADFSVMSLEDATRLVAGAPFLKLLHADPVMVAGIAADAAPVASSLVLVLSGRLTFSVGTIAQLDETLVSVVPGIRGGELLLGRDMLGVIPTDVWLPAIGSVAQGVGLSARTSEEPTHAVHRAFPESAPVGDAVIDYFERSELGDRSDPELVRAILEEELRRVAQSGLPLEEQARLRDCVMGPCIDMFRERLCATDPPILCDPIPLKWSQEAQRVRVPPRRMTAEELTWLKNFCDLLERCGMIMRAPEATMACAALAYPVPKHHVDPEAPLESIMRLIVVFRPVNKFAVPLSWPSADPSQFHELLAGSAFFATLDVYSGFWQLPLHTPMLCRTVRSPLPGVCTYCSASRSPKAFSMLQPSSRLRLARSWVHWRTMG
jgi:hypothetical protein